MISINLFVPDCLSAIEFYQKVFGAMVIAKRVELPKGERSIRLKIGGDHFALFDENQSVAGLSPKSLGGCPISIQIFVDPVLSWHNDSQGRITPYMVSGVSGIIKNALDNGCTLVLPCTNSEQIVHLSDGSELCNIRDPYGYLWSICSQPKNQQLLPLDKYFSLV